MSGPLEPGNPSSSLDVERRSVVEVGRSSIIIPKCGGWIGSVWYFDEMMVKYDDM